MRLALNTFVYEVGKVPVKKALKSAKKFGFEFVDLAAYNSGDPTLMSKVDKEDLLKIFQDFGLKSSQLLLVNTQHIASSNASLRKKTIDYMKRCADFQLELDGKQVLVCWGCGIYEDKMLKEQTWINSVITIQEYANWCLDKKILIDLELDPHVYFIVNSLEKMAKMIEDVGMPNVFPNIDIGHLCITREPPGAMEKVKGRILHVHISETDTFAHTNSIIGSGKVDFKSYLDKLFELGIEENCKRYDEVAVAGIEMGEPGGEVDEPERWVKESLFYIKKNLPELIL
ncbi:sugar phosphate isomerase/epimerase [Candidatus Aerophobetes bacterium]|nr:sugar phosphate isomerase/epimerase [Candidatus Aerophobetes bacterium]